MPKEEKKYTIGLDIGGTKMSAVLFDGAKVLADDSLATPRDDLEHFMVMLKALIEPMRERAKELKVKVAGIGLGIPGPINYKERKILVCNNIHIIDGLKLALEVEKDFSLPAKMDHDISCMLRAEMKVGAGQKYKNAYGVTISTGIGGAWWFNNKIYRGIHGGAGEPGEMVIDFKEEITLEDAYHKLTQNNPANLAEEAYRGDVLAEKFFSEVGQNLGIAFANIVNIVDPEVIIVCGGAIESSDLFLSKAKKAMRDHIHSPESRKKVKIIKAKLGKLSGAIGAAMLV